MGGGQASDAEAWGNLWQCFKWLPGSQLSFRILESVLPCFTPFTVPSSSCDP